jgi:tRNA (guanine37-N1)-methyltransferase
MSLAMTITILTLFPEFFISPLATSMMKRAVRAEAVTFNIIDIRDFASDKYQTTDDRPFGGGPGMVMKVEPIAAALASLQGNKHVVLTSAKGKTFTQQTAETYSKTEHLVIICGHYEGVDERVAEHYVDEEVRIGDYVMTGGEPAALVMADAVTRLLPGVLGNEDSTTLESHTQSGLLGFPQYTRPEEYNGWKVPDVLMSGDHQKIAEWRRSQMKTVEDPED